MALFTFLVFLHSFTFWVISVYVTPSLQMHCLTQLDINVP